LLWHNEAYEAWVEAGCLSDRGQQYQVSCFVSLLAQSFSSFCTHYYFIWCLFLLIYFTLVQVLLHGN
jgi:hypothetical protein